MIDNLLGRFRTNTQSAPSSPHSTVQEPAPVLNHTPDLLVRPDLETQAMIDIIAAQQAQFIAQAQTLAHVSPSVSPAAQPPFNLIHRPGHGTQSAPINNIPPPVPSA